MLKIFFSLIASLLVFSNLFADYCPQNFTFKLDGSQIKAYDADGNVWTSSEGDWSQANISSYVFQKAEFFDGGYRDLDGEITCFYASTTNGPLLRMAQSSPRALSQGSNWVADIPIIMHCPISSEANNHVDLCPFSF